MPRKSKHMLITAIQSDERHLSETNAKKSTISQYFATTACPTECGNFTETGLCNNCIKSNQRTSIILCDKISKLDRKYAQIKKVSFLILFFNFNIQLHRILIQYRYANRVVDVLMKYNAYH